ncbi:hypothetical protein I350_03607 [Cryptococcus amylolentus CBS 6273]|uniref:Cytochrome P450 n=1 Tax=Cryptococcus amylolentus CBS 6273 TaxID=1296118 RepID=A0A1E3K4B7_9TREE|nr:hypothetical protein I350_03607 [Cryptococcus amylolentus CBS 6273]
MAFSAGASIQWLQPSTSGMSYTQSFAIVLTSIFFVLLGTYLLLWPIAEWRLPASFRNLPGPRDDSWIAGVLPSLLTEPVNAPHTRWTNTYGLTLRYRIFFGIPRLLTIDPTVLSYVLYHPDLFPKCNATKRMLVDMVGKGLLVVEGEEHRKQRRALSACFTPNALKGMTSIFYDKAYELKDKLANMIEGVDPEICAPTPTKAADEVEGGKQIDVMRYLAKTTLDVIGLAGFSYDFNSLSESRNELADAFGSMFAAGAEIGFVGFLQIVFPVLKWIPTARSKAIARAKEVTQRIGLRIIQDKKGEIMATHEKDLEKNVDLGKDLLSILIKANMAADLKPEDRLTDQEVLDQITTFMFAGNETTSTAVTWCLYQFAKKPEVQERLREEVLAVADERPSLDTLHSLKYMDIVVREVLRLYAPVPTGIRKAGQDIVIPLGTPVIGRDQQIITSVEVSKGTAIFVPTGSINTSPLLWGPDATEFRPERFSQDLSTGSTGGWGQIPGVWGNVMTFLGGPHNCIGYRFSLAEIKVLLFVLLRNFEFQELHSKPEIEKKASVVMRPKVVGEEEAGPQLPLMVRPISAL